MPNSNRGGFGRGNGTITVIEERVRRSYRRKAKIVFYLVWVITGLLAATVAASKWHPILALVPGAAFGLITGAIAGAIVFAWPVIRAIWWRTQKILCPVAVVPDVMFRARTELHLAVPDRNTGEPRSTWSHELFCTYCGRARGAGGHRPACLRA
jgi:hypothetical protein